ncbi:hypothetical protein QOT17_003401 [Balamuthia mandrillaris]
MSYRRSSGSFSLVCRQVPGLRVTAARSSLLTASVTGRCSSATAPSPLTRCASAFSSLSCSPAATGFSTTATSGGGASSRKASFLKQQHSTSVLLSAPCTKTTTATMNFGMLLQFLNTEEDDDGC